MKGARFGERLYAINLESLVVDGIPVISKAVMDLVYGRISGKNDQVFFRTRSLPLGMEEESIFGRMSGVERRRLV